MSDEIIEGEVQEDTMSIIPHDTRDDLAVMPVIDLAKAEQRYNQMVSFVQKIMRPDVDYGTIPGTMKPTLYKPGAEKLATFFGLRKTFILQDKIEDWNEEDPLFFYRYKAQLWRGDILIAEGIGSASSREDRYRWRWVSEDKIPAYLDPDNLETRGGKVSEFEFAIKEGRTEGEYAKPQEYWDRFKAAIADGTAKSILKQARSGKEYDAWEIDSVYYRVPNADVFTLINTIDKMAQKRAFIQAVLLGVNASEFFTQDVEDMPIEALSGEEDRYTPPPQYQNDKAVEAAETLFGEEGGEGLKKLKEQHPKGTRPWKPEDVRNRIKQFVPEYKGERKDQTRPGGTLVTYIAWQMSGLFAGDPNADGKRISVLSYLLERQVNSTNDCNGSELKAIERWLEPKDWRGDGITPRAESVSEAAEIFVTYMKEQGQQELIDG